MENVSQNKSAHWQSLLKKCLPDALVLLVFLGISFAYFMTPLSQGMVLGGHDTIASIGQGQEQLQYRAEHGETTRWTNALFSGMPTYQIAPSYESTSLLSWLEKVYRLGTDGPLSYIFLYLLGFYILMRAFNFKPYLAALGAIVWAFSSYFFIIIAAGHIWKVLTLAFIPPTIAGLVLCYCGRLLWGGVTTALFTALQVLSNHVQMTYYFLFVMLFIVLAYGVDAVLKKKFTAFARATGVALLAGLIGVAANLPSLYHTYQYSKESMRGKAELTPLPSERRGGAATDGLERDYITQWSYGVGETMTLMIPGYYGGGSGERMLDNPKAEKSSTYLSDAGSLESQIGRGFPGWAQYWGEQPMTVGPVYVGALVCFLFVLGLFFVRGPLKWALLLSTMLSLLFAWGKNTMAITNFFIDFLPMYSKFRTVSSALVIAEFTMPLLAMLCLAKIVQKPDELWQTRHGRIGLGVATACTAGLCLLLSLVPSLAGSFVASVEEEGFTYLSQYFPHFRSGVVEVRQAILSGDALRSFFIIALSLVLIWLYVRRRIKASVLCVALTVICLIDMWGVNKRYLNDESFSDPVAQLQGFDKTAADEQILRDKGLSHRVLNLSQGNPFNETSNRTSYWHKSIGGYNAAKLHRYQDLIDRHLNQEVQSLAQAINAHQGDLKAANADSLLPCLNMLNMKYVIIGGGGETAAHRDPRALHTGRTRRDPNLTTAADEEMTGLTGLDTKRTAVADVRFETALSGTALDSGTVALTKYLPNELHYDIASPKGGVAVFSEIYYPGWTATIDGKEAEVARVNYVLRALKIPAGAHKVVMTFRPSSITTTEAIAYTAIGLIILGMLTVLLKECGVFRRKQTKE